MTQAQQAIIPKARIALFTTIALTLLFAIAGAGFNLLSYLAEQDQFFAEGLSRSTHAFVQLHREVLRLTVLVEASDKGAYREEIELQLNLVKSRFKVIERHLTADINQELLTAWDEVDKAWQRLGA